MSERVGGAGEAPRSGRLIRSPRDFWGGIGLVLLALFALWAAGDLLGISQVFKFGPGTAPRLFGYSMMALGAAITLVGLLTDGEEREPFALTGPLGGALLLLVLIPIAIFSSRIGKLLPGVAADVVIAAVTTVVVIALALVLTRIAPRGPLFITAATIMFGVTVRPLGLIIASFVSLVVSAAATAEIRWVETLIWAAILTAFCAFLFPYGLNLPLQLWPRF